jgi:hypothetical protein
MNRSVVIALALASVLGVAGVVAAQADKVAICHRPPGNPDNAHTITIGGPAAEAHMNEHGDASGACPGEEAKGPREKDKPSNPPGETNPPSENPGPTTAATPGITPAWIWLLLLVLAGIAAGTAVVLRQRQKGNP